MVTIDGLLAELEEMKDLHGGDCIVLSGLESIETVGYSLSDDGRAKYINIGR